MDIVEAWLEFDSHIRRTKFINQCVGLLIAVVVLLLTTAGRPWRHPLSVDLIGLLLLSILIHVRTTLSTLPWRLCSIAYVALLAAVLRSELACMGPLGVTWSLPTAGALVLVSSLFMGRRVDYGLVAVSCWMILLLGQPALPALARPSLIVIYLLTVTGFGVLMNRTYILGSLRLIRARDDFRQLSEHDALTGLENRRKFMVRMDGLVASQTCHLLLLLDVDHFKYINDCSGHDAGDQALVQLAEVIRAAPRVLACARVGGEEFAVILACTDESEHEPALHAYCEHLSRFTLPATLSGGAVWPARMPSAARALVAADAQLYMAKHAGRNRIYFNDQRVCRMTRPTAVAG